VSINQLLVLPSFLLFFSSSFAGGDNPPMGARSSGLAHASVTLCDLWSIFNNASGMASLKNMQAGFTYENRFATRSFDRVGALFICPIKYGVAGLSFYKFGDKHYNEEKAGLAYAHEIMKVRLGIKVNYLQISMEELRSRRALVIEFGGIAEITPQLVFGAHIYNLNQAKIRGYQKEYVPTVMKAGFSYRPSDKLMINIETEKDIDFKACFKAGMEYKIIDKFYLRTGVSTYPFTGSFGIGFSKKNFQIDYAYSTHTRLGFISQLSLQYKFNKK
jgi:hypothetical protein